MVTYDQQFPRPAGEEKIAFQGKILELVQQDNEVAPGKTVTFEWARRSPGVRLIVLSKDKTEVLLTKEYRRELHDYDYRLPGGKVFDTLQSYNDFLRTKADIVKPAQEKVVGEAVEEAGLTVQAAELIHTSKLGATVEWDLLYFVVTSFKEHADGQQLEDGEDITVEWTTTDQAKDMALNGHMSEERSALVLLRYLNQL
jgi:hypothetical protein